MDVKTYYKRNISYKFDEQKQKDVLKNYSKEQLKTELNRQLEIQRDCLFDKVNSKSSNKKMIDLIVSLYENNN